MTKQVTTASHSESQKRKTPTPAQMLEPVPKLSSYALRGRGLISVGVSPHPTRMWCLGEVEAGVSALFPRFDLAEGDFSMAVDTDCFEVGVLGCASFCEADDVVDFEGDSCCSAVGAGVVVAFEDAPAGGGWYMSPHVYSHLR